jgi:trehalose utilization protein
MKSRPNVRVTVWGEDAQELWPESIERVEELYPGGVHEGVAGMLRARLGSSAQIRTATMKEPEHGLSPEELDATDVLVWWGHMANDELPDEVARRVQRRVLDGMGLIVLHSSIESKPFRLLMGTTCTFARWRDADDREVVWTVAPAHPIADGVPPVFVIPQHEMYSEFFDIPAPDELVFISSFTGGEVFRSGGCFQRGKGRIFYFSPGHEMHPVFHQQEVQRILANAVTWANARSDSPIELGPAQRAMDESWYAD